MEESDLDRAHRRGQRWRVVFIAAYCALVVYCLATPAFRIVGILLIPGGAYLLARRFLNVAFDDVPHWWRKLAYRGWHGKYRAFDDCRVRVIDGERDAPSRVFAADIFAILDLPPPEDGESLFTDAACVAFVRGYLDEQRSPRGRTAHKLALWLERSVFMPIDNRRTAATGKSYAFTKETARR